MRRPLAFTVTGLVALAAAYPAAANWSEPAPGPLNADPAHDADSASVATIGGTPYVAWEEYGDGTYYEVRVKRLDTSGWAAVGGALNVDSGQDAYYPSVADVAGMPYVAWEENNGSAQYQIRVKRLEGGSWTAVGGSLNVDPSRDGDNPVIASIGGVPYVTWRESNGTRDQIRVKRLENGNWTAVGDSLNVDVADNAGTPMIADVAGVPYLAWREDDGTATQLRVKRLENGSWAAVGGSLNADPTQDADGVAIASVGGVPYVAWPESEGGHEHMRVKRLEGDAWTPVGGVLNADASHDAFNPSIAGFGSTPVVAWYEYDGTSYNVFVKRFDGTAWAPVGGVLDVDASKSANRPSVASVGGVPYVAWDEYDAGGIQQIRAKRLDLDILGESAVPSATGATLAAQVDDFGLALPVAFEYGTTAALGTATPLQATAGAGASTVSADVAGLAPSTAYSFRAFGSDGTRRTSLGATQAFTTLAAAGTSPPPPGIARITNLLLTPATFMAGRGTLVSYDDSQAATTTFTVQRPGVGRRKGDRCVKARKRPPKAKRCKRWRKVGGFTHQDVAGHNELHFSGRVKGRKLKPGRYRLRAVPRTSAGAGQAVTKRFRVKRR